MTAVEAYWLNQNPSKLVFQANNARDTIPRKKMNAQVPKYAADVVGTQLLENTASPNPV